jgi:HlyD family secretion protein
MMRFLLKFLLIFVVVGGLSYGAWVRGNAWLKERNKPQFRTSAVEEGEIRISVNASGEVKPVLSVQVGSFVSGPIQELFVDFNEEVTANQILATIDPRIYDAAVLRDTASLETRKAEVFRVEAELQRAKNDEQRSLNLREENEDFISRTELDQYKFARQALEAQLVVAKAMIKQAEATLQTSSLQLGYTKIRSPVDGVVIDRKIDPGQTLAAQFQTPELFVVAPDIRKEVHIFASINEAEIGLIREAKDNEQSVYFTVDAYPEKLFEEGRIEQIRFSSTVNQNVVTYPVVVATPNNDLLLLPGMTANLTFQIRALEDIVKVPNAALWFRPAEKTMVRAEDQNRLDLTVDTEPDDEAQKTTNVKEPPVDQSVASKVAASKRVVWVRDGDLLRAVDVKVGESDYRFTRLIEGDLKPGDEVVVGVKSRG